MSKIEPEQQLRCPEPIMLFPWYATTMLALEASDVMMLRLIKLAAGGWDAVAEAELMVKEKIDALAEAGRSLREGATPAKIIGRYREHVAVNAARLGTALETR